MSQPVAPIPLSKGDQGKDTMTSSSTFACFHLGLHVSSVRLALNPGLGTVERGGEGRRREEKEVGERGGDGRRERWVEEQSKTLSTPRKTCFLYL